MADAYDWRVVYQRAGWKHSHQKVFKKKGSSVNLVNKFLAGGMPDLAPLTVLRVDKRPKGTKYGGWVPAKAFVGPPVP